MPTNVFGEDSPDTAEANTRAKDLVSRMTYVIEELHSRVADGFNHFGQDETGVVRLLLIVDECINHETYDGNGFAFLSTALNSVKPNHFVVDPLAQVLERRVPSDLDAARLWIVYCLNMVDALHTCLKAVWELTDVVDVFYKKSSPLFATRVNFRAEMLKLVALLHHPRGGGGGMVCEFKLDIGALSAFHTVFRAQVLKEKPELTSRDDVAAMEHQHHEQHGGGALVMSESAFSTTSGGGAAASAAGGGATKAVGSVNNSSNSNISDLRTSAGSVSGVAPTTVTTTHTTGGGKKIIKKKIIRSSAAAGASSASPAPTSGVSGGDGISLEDSAGSMNLSAHASGHALLSQLSTSSVVGKHHQPKTDADVQAVAAVATKSVQTTENDSNRSSSARSLDELAELDRALTERESALHEREQILKESRVHLHNMERELEANSEEMDAKLTSVAHVADAMKQLYNGMFSMAHSNTSGRIEKEDIDPLIPKLMALLSGEEIFVTAGSSSGSSQGGGRKTTPPPPKPAVAPTNKKNQNPDLHQEASATTLTTQNSSFVVVNDSFGTSSQKSRVSPPPQATTATTATTTSKKSPVIAPQQSGGGAQPPSISVSESHSSSSSSSSAFANQNSQRQRASTVAVVSNASIASNTAAAGAAADKNGTGRSKSPEAQPHSAAASLSARGGRGSFGIGSAGSSPTPSLAQLAGSSSPAPGSSSRNIGNLSFSGSVGGSSSGAQGLSPAASAAKARGIITVAPDTCTTRPSSGIPYLITNFEETERNVQLERQRNRCPKCQGELTRNEANNPLLRSLVNMGQLALQQKPRRCHYSGEIFCQKCHTNKTAIIPHKVCATWDFEEYHVSDNWYDYLANNFERPIIHLPDVDFVAQKPVARQLAQYRRKLNRMHAVLCLCPAIQKQSKSVFTTSYYFSREHWWSLADLVRMRLLEPDAPGSLSRGVPNADLLQHLGRLMSDALEHIDGCANCRAKGYGVCTLCTEVGDEKTAFWEDGAVCTSCGSIFHALCFEVRGCPKCKP